MKKENIEAMARADAHFARECGHSADFSDPSTVAELILEYHFTKEEAECYIAEYNKSI